MEDWINDIEKRNYKSHSGMVQNRLLYLSASDLERDITKIQNKKYNSIAP